MEIKKERLLERFLRYVSFDSMSDGSAVGKRRPTTKCQEDLRLHLSSELKDVASSSCVIVGLSASHILRKDSDLVTVFIKAPEEARLDRAINVYGVDRKKAQKLLRRMDTARSSYFEYVSDRKWGMARNYNITIDSSMTGIDGAVEVILSFLKRAGRL